MSTTESVLLDTSIIVAHFRREPALAEQLKAATLYIPLPVLGELYYGAFKSANQPKTLKQLQEFLRICAILPPDELTAQHYGHIKSDLERVGSRIPENDLWIAAIAREHEMPLVNPRSALFLGEGFESSRLVIFGLRHHPLRFAQAFRERLRGRVFAFASFPS